MRGREVGRGAQVVWGSRGAAHVCSGGGKRKTRETGPLTQAASSLSICSMDAWRSE